MKKPVQRIAFLMAVALSVGLLAACAPAESTPGTASTNTATTSSSPQTSVQPVTIKHWFWPDSDRHIEIFNSMVADFNATNGKGITVEVEAHPWDGGQYSEDLFTAAMGGGAPDTAGFKLTSTPLFTNNGLLESLESYIDGWDKKDDIDETLLNTLRSAAPDGKLYLMPWNIQVLYVYYRPSYFTMAGVTETPKTYEAFLEAIEKCTMDTNNDGKTDIYGYGIRGSKGGQEPWGSFVYARGGSFEDLTSPESIQGMQDFIDIYKNGYAPPSAPNDGFNEIIGNFQAGLTAMTIQHIGSSTNMIEKFGDDVDAFMFPDSPDGRWTSMGDTETVMFASSANKEAAFEWISYLAAGKGQETWCVETGNVPVSARVKALPAIQENRFMAVSIEGAPFAGIIPVRDTTTEWISTLWPATIQQALLGQITAEQAMQQLSEGLYGK